MKTGNITDIYNELILTRTNSGGMSSYQFVEFVVYYCVFIPGRKAFSRKSIYANSYYP